MEWAPGRHFLPHLPLPQDLPLIRDDDQILSLLWNLVNLRPLGNQICTEIIITALFITYRYHWYRYVQKSSLPPYLLCKGSTGIGMYRNHHYHLIYYVKVALVQVVQKSSLPPYLLWICSTGIGISIYRNHHYHLIYYGQVALVQAPFKCLVQVCTSRTYVRLGLYGRKSKWCNAT